MGIPFPDKIHPSGVFFMHGLLLVLHTLTLTHTFTLTLTPSHTLVHIVSPQIWWFTVARRRRPVTRVRGNSREIPQECVARRHRRRWIIDQPGVVV